MENNSASDKLNSSAMKYEKLKYKPISGNLRIGIDIGGTLTKICIVLTKQQPDIINLLTEEKMFEIVETASHLIFFNKFQTVNFQIDMWPILQKLKSFSEVNEIQATGGGAYRFCDLMDKQYGIKFIKHDELISLVHGYLFMNNYKAFYYLNQQDQMERIESGDLVFPHISVNIGSGVSLLKVLSPDEISRVGGTLMGGGTLIGLSKLLINVDNYNDILELAKKGNHTNVDLTIKDIYGGDSVNLNLNSEVVASSFGKIHEYINVDKMNKINKEDIATSLLTMICFHITQLASLLAKENKITKVYYFGNFSRRNSAAIRCLDQCMQFWDKNLSVRYNYYDGYLGSIGTLVE